MLMYATDANTTLRNGQELNRESVLDFRPIWSWAPGLNALRTDEHSGMPFKKSGKYTHLIMSMHYDNPLRESGDWDRSGFRVHFTPDLRATDLRTTVATNYQNGVDIGLIPAGESSFYKSHICKVDLHGHDNVTVVGFFGHAHLAGRAVFSEQYRGCKKVRDLNREMSFSFDDQRIHYFSPGLVIQNGDVIQNTCIYNTTGRNESTYGGFGSRDEMCFAMIYYRPATWISCETIDFYDGVTTDEDYNVPFAESHPAPVSGSTPGCGNGTKEEEAASLGPVVFSVLSGQCEAQLTTNQIEELKTTLLDPETDTTLENLPNLIVEMVLAICGLVDVGNQCQPECLNLLGGLVTCIPAMFSDFTAAFPVICENFEANV